MVDIMLAGIAVSSLLEEEGTFGVGCLGMILVQQFRKEALLAHCWVSPWMTG